MQKQRRGTHLGLSIFEPSSPSRPLSSVSSGGALTSDSRGRRWPMQNLGPLMRRSSTVVLPPSSWVCFWKGSCRRSRELQQQRKHWPARTGVFATSASGPPSSERCCRSRRVRGRSWLRAVACATSVIAEGTDVGDASPLKTAGCEGQRLQHP